ncbi:hypothetical protein CerSpe_257820 [Prunus speciosa]
MFWVQYDGVSRQLDVFTAEQLGDPRRSDFFIMPSPTDPILTANLNLKDIVERKSYFGFSASTGTATQLNCVLRWNLTVEKLTDVGSEDRTWSGCPPWWCCSCWASEGDETVGVWAPCF